jgi:hypothetical protein
LVRIGSFSFGSEIAIGLRGSVSVCGRSADGRVGYLNAVLEAVEL